MKADLAIRRRTQPDQAQRQASRPASIGDGRGQQGRKARMIARGWAETRQPVIDGLDGLNGAIGGQLIDVVHRIDQHAGRKPRGSQQQRLDRTFQFIRSLDTAGTGIGLQQRFIQPARIAFELDIGNPARKSGLGTDPAGKYLGQSRQLPLCQHGTLAIQDDNISAQQDRPREFIVNQVCLIDGNGRIGPDCRRHRGQRLHRY